MWASELFEIKDRYNVKPEEGFAYQYIDWWITDKIHAFTIGDWITDFMELYQLFLAFRKEEKKKKKWCPNT